MRGVVWLRRRQRQQRRWHRPFRFASPPHALLQLPARHTLPTHCAVGPSGVRCGESYAVCCLFRTTRRPAVLCRFFARSLARRLCPRPFRPFVRVPGLCHVMSCHCHCTATASAPVRVCVVCFLLIPCHCIASSHPSPPPHRFHPFGAASRIRANAPVAWPIVAPFLSFPSPASAAYCSLLLCCCSAPSCVVAAARVRCCRSP